MQSSKERLAESQGCCDGFSEQLQVDLNNKCVVNNWSLSFQLLQHPCSHMTMFWALGNHLTRWLQCPKVTCSSFVTFSANQAKSEDKQAGKITSCLGKSQQPLQASKNTVLMLHGLPPTHTFTHPVPLYNVPLHTLCAPSPTDQQLLLFLLACLQVKGNFLIASP